jgi:hypothetical protein
MDCSYCTDPAIGYDHEALPTCGCKDTCTAVVSPLPAVVEVSENEEPCSGCESEICPVHGEGD